MALPSPRKAIFVAFFLLNRDKSRFLEELDPGAGGTSIGEAGAGGGEDGSALNISLLRGFHDLDHCNNHGNAAGTPPDR